MKKTDIAAFFDRCAPWWDADMIRNEDIIATILDNGGIREGAHVLDVACGTGVLFPDYLARNVASVTAIDISPEMAKLAASKFPEVHVICGDVENTKFDRQFDCIMVYNAFPHFPDPVHLIEVLAGLLKYVLYRRIALKRMELADPASKNIRLIIFTGIKDVNNVILKLFKPGSKRTTRRHKKAKKHNESHKAHNFNSFHKLPRFTVPKWKARDIFLLLLHCSLKPNLRRYKLQRRWNLRSRNYLH